ncbi:MAG TPA: hypothetical protein VFI16_02575 [Anaeromyxobacteraceae bacterium]|nr:hypothetical protein [Anaeromyxobacteraceae bacterium]
MALGPVPSGRAIEQSAEELLRIWRLARAEARREIFPGLLDGVMGAFFARCGRLLAESGAPDDVWSGLVGIVRWSPAHGARDLTGEWAIAMEVLSAACESFEANPKVAEWLARAVAAAEKGTAAIRERSKKPVQPDGILLLVVYGDLALQRRGARGAEG